MVESKLRDGCDDDFDVMSEYVVELDDADLT